MFLGAAGDPSPYDVRFSVLGIPVRIVPWFWVAAAFLGWDIAARMPNRILVLVLWVAAVLISLLVHEMGHALAFRLYGLRSQIVLYHFGGFASPFAEDWSRRGWTRGRWHQIVISAAGPAFQLALAALLIGLTIVTLGAVVWFVGSGALGGPDRPMPGETFLMFLGFIISVSICWALFNLLPIYPLDGGQISREIFTMLGPINGYRNSLILSLIVAGGLALVAFRYENFFNGMLCLSLAIGNFQELQAGWGGQGRGRW